MSTKEIKGKEVKERSMKKSLSAAVSSVVHSVAKVFGRGIRMSKRTWNSKEDKLITELVKTEGTNWSLISSHLTNRSGKQCRERYYNHLQSDIKKGGWSVAEDEATMKLNIEYGNQWVKIMKFLPGRTDNAIKNRYHAILRAQNAEDSSKYVGCRHEHSDGVVSVAVAQPIHVAIPIQMTELECVFDDEMDLELNSDIDESSPIHAFINDEEMSLMLKENQNKNKGSAIDKNCIKNINIA